MHFAVFSLDSQTHLQKPQGIYTAKTFRKTWVRKKNCSSSLKQCNFSPKENKKQNKTKQKQTTEKQTQIKTGMNTTFHVVIKHYGIAPVDTRR